MIIVPRCRWFVGIATIGGAPCCHEGHSHGGGAEILVLEGVFEDEYGSYPACSWLRNPPGSVHWPWSEAGCKIWVKTGHLPITVAAEVSGAGAAVGSKP